MSKLKYLFIVGFYLLPGKALALTTRGTPAELTKPAGGDILPGGQVFQEDIKGSVIFSRILPFAITWTICNC
jgi:hypothetical protein